MESVSFVIAVKRHLTLDGEKASQLMAEIKNLTPQDRLELTEQFKKEFDYDIKS